MKIKLPKINNYETFAKVNPTVDIACFNHNNTFMLFGRKATDIKLRLVGGFASVTDQCFEDTAAREFQEETSCELENIQYICSQLSNDWRFRESNDKIITSLFYGQLLNDSNLKAADDIVEVKWIDLNSLFESPLEDIIIEGHISLVNEALTYINNQ